jgi:ankyrin repeat protein
MKGDAMKTSVILGLTSLLLAAGPAGAQGIFDAVRAGDLAGAKAIVGKDTSLVRARDASGNTPLHAAAIAGSVPLAEWLLAQGAEINAENPARQTPLTAAIANSKDDVALLLIERGADIAGPAGALAWAAMRNRAAVAERLIARGADVDQKRGEYTPLGVIIRGGHKSFEVFELLMRKGANINPRDSLGNTPLDNAAIYGEDDRMIDLLLDRSAEVNTDPAALRTSMAAAARKGHLRLFEYYRARGGEALFADNSSRRALMRSAILGGSLELVKALRARGIPLDSSPNAGGLTPLHALASRPGTLEMIEFLARNGAEIDARTNDGRSAYNIADANGNREAAALLVKLGASAGPQKFPVLTGPYLGQTPPGDELRPFAPGIIQQDHGTISFSPDGQEVYWPTGRSIMTMRVRDGRWTQPTYAPFSGPSEIDFYDDVPFVAPDGKRLYFTSLRPLGPETSRKENIWFVERTAEGWSEPKPVGEAVNSLRLHWQVSVSNSGALYFGGGFDILCSRPVDGKYAPPVALGPGVNTESNESQPFIAPDESYILFWRAAGQVPTAYVSFKGSDGEWLPATKLDLTWAPGGLMVTPDGKYLFTGGRWKSAKFLEGLRPKGERP